MITTQCPKCSATLRVKDENEGKQGKCPKCAEVFIVRGSETPGLLEAVEPAPAGPAEMTVTLKNHETRAAGAFGIVALILGILSCLTCWIPIIGMLAVPSSALGILFGIIGVVVAVVRRTSFGLSAAATVICIITLTIALGVTRGFLNWAGGKAEEARQNIERTVPD